MLYAAQFGVECNSEAADVESEVLVGDVTWYRKSSGTYCFHAHTHNVHFNISHTHNNNNRAIDHAPR